MKRSVVVTGVSTGIGWGAVKVLIAKGFHVFGSVRKQSDADRLKQEFGDAFTPLIFDVTDEAGAKAAAEQVRTALKGETLAGLVNNAGIAVAGPLFHLPVDEFRQQMEVNVSGVVITTQAFGPLLGGEPGQKGPRGRIVNISSVNGQTGQFGQTNYAAAKAGMHGFTMALAREVARKGVTVNSVSPGYCETAMVMAVPEAVRERIVESVPVGRLGRPHEIARAVTFLTADDAGFITGANLPVNGGLFMSF